MAFDVVDDSAGRRLCLRHACDVRRQDDLWMPPETMFGGQGFRFGDVDDRTRQMSLVESRNERVMIELRAAPHVYERRARWKGREDPGVE